ncbi:hypothetical protein [Streptomyces sp. NPDC004726]
MGRQAKWAVGVGALILALIGGIFAAMSGGDEPEPSSQEQVKQAAEAQIAALKRGEIAGALLWEQRMAAGGYSRTSALPDEEACRERWQALDLAKEFGDSNDFLFISSCVQAPADKLLGG